MDSKPPITPADAFELVGNEIRVGIIQVLQDAYRDGDRSLPYATLQSRVGVRDSGQFNYHLQQLVGQFVKKDGSDYRLTYAGQTVASAIVSGAYNSRTTFGPESVDGSCYGCGAERLELTYQRERFRVHCRACGEEVVHMPFPPGSVAERESEALRRAFDRWARAWNTLAATGFCPECSGQVSATLAKEAGELTIGDVSVRAVLECDQCWMRGYLPVGFLLLDHPAVTSFFWQRGYDVRDDYIWQHEWALSEDFQTVIDEDPYHLQIRVPVDDDELRITVDDSLTVIETVEHGSHHSR